MLTALLLTAAVHATEWQQPPQEVLDVLPLDMVHTLVVLFPGESIAYLGGAILLYSEAWLR